MAINNFAVTFLEAVELKTYNLDKGINVRLIPGEKFKTNLLSVCFNVPLERKTITFASLLCLVLKSGCAKYPTITDVSKQLEQLFGASHSFSARKKGNSLELIFSCNFVSERYAGEDTLLGAAELMRNMIFEPYLKDGAFSAEYVSREKENLRRAIESIINDKKEYAQAKCIENMFKGDPYGLFDYGYVEDLDKINEKNLYEYYLNVINNSCADIFLSGPMDEEAALGVIKNEIGSRLAPRDAEYTKTFAAKERGGVLRVTEPVQASQSKLCIGLTCRCTDVYALMLATCIFGGSPVSKLFLNVREKLSLAYYAAARVETKKKFMLISSGIETDKFDEAFNEIMAQLECMKAGKIDDFETEAAKKYMKTAYDAMQDGLRGVEDFYLSKIIEGSSVTIDEQLQNILRVSKEEVVRAARGIELDTVFFLKGEMK